MAQCETCIHFPASTFGGKPCCTCEPNDPLYSAYEKVENLYAKAVLDVANTIQSVVDSGKYVIVSEGAEVLFSVTKRTLRSACKKLTDTGEYHIINMCTPKPDGCRGYGMAVRLLVPKKTSWEDVWNDRENIAYAGM